MLDSTVRKSILAQVTTFSPIVKSNFDEVVALNSVFQKCTVFVYRHVQLRHLLIQSCVNSYIQFLCKAINV